MENKRVVSTKQGEEFKTNFKLDFFEETSAKSGKNVKKLFIDVAKTLYQDYLEFKEKESTVRSDTDTENKVNNPNLKIPLQRPQKESECNC